MMRVDTRTMRAAVKGWLQEEQATVEQALQLQVAIEAGAIAGNDYAGYREYPQAELSAVSSYRRETGCARGDRPVAESRGCGCLLDTLERIKHSRPSRAIPGESASAQTFALALMLRLGDTPSNSRWARAAVRGIADYLAELEALVPA